MTAPNAPGRPAPTPLRRLRVAHGLSLQRIAGRAACSLESVRQLDRGPFGGVKLRTLIRVAHAVGVPATALVPGLAARPTSPGLVALRSGLEAAGSSPAPGSTTAREPSPPGRLAVPLESLEPPA